jgi:hypothetical protein
VAAKSPFQTVNGNQLERWRGDNAKSHFDNVRIFGSAGDRASGYVDVGKRSTERMVLSA